MSQAGVGHLRAAQFKTLKTVRLRLQFPQALIGNMGVGKIDGPEVGNCREVGQRIVAELWPGQLDVQPTDERKTAEVPFPYVDRKRDEHRQILIATVPP